MRGGVVLDNLTSDGTIPPTVGIFVDPGRRLETATSSGKQRNLEYDALDDRYATFLLQEVVPLAREHISLTDDPEGWTICGGSSGGNCALTVAWHRPDRFRGVIANLSSFAQIPGGNPFPTLISSTPRKPIRIFQQAARNDLGHGQPVENWYADNLRVSAALDEAGYEHRLVIGDGGHHPNHGGTLLPEAIRWVPRR